MRRLRSLAALAAILLIPPAVLLAAAGPPSLSGLSFGSIRQALLDDYFSPDSFLSALALAAWALWAYMVVMVAVRIAGRLLENHSRLGRSLVVMTDRSVPRLLRKVADGAVGAALFVSVAATPLALSSQSATPAYSAADSSVANVRSLAPEIDAKPPGPPPEQPAAAAEHEVRKGESLWRIAEEELGHGIKWPEIYEQNKGRVFPDGRVLEDPNLIYPQWMIKIPGGSVVPEEVPQPAEPTNSEAPAGAEPPPPASVPPPPEVTFEAIPEAPVPEIVLPAPSPAPATQSDSQQVIEERAEFSVEEDSPQESLNRPEPRLTLPSGSSVAASLGAGILASSAIAFARRRRRRSSTKLPTDPEPEEKIVRKIRKAAGNRLLEADIAGHAENLSSLWMDQLGEAPHVVAAAEGADQITFLITSPSKDVVETQSIGPFVLKPQGSFVAAETDRSSITNRTSDLNNSLFIPGGSLATGEVIHLNLMASGPLAVSGSRRCDFATQGVLHLANLYRPDDLEIFLLGVPNWDPRLVGLAHVRMAASWEEDGRVLDGLDLELLARSRNCMKQGCSDVRQLAAKAPGEGPPPLVLVVSKPPETVERILNELSRKAKGLGVAIIAVDWCPATAEITLESDSEIQMRATTPELTVRLRPVLLSEEELNEAVDLALQAHPHVTETPETSRENFVLPPSSEVDGQTPAGQAVNGSSNGQPNAGVGDVPGELPTESLRGNGAAIPPIDLGQRPISNESAPTRESEDAEETPAEETSTEQAPTGISASEGRRMDTHTDGLVSARPREDQVEVRCFGPLTVYRNGRPIRKEWRTKSRELLGLLVVNRQGLSKDQLIDALHPEDDLKWASLEMNRHVYSLRTRVRGEQDAREYVERSNVYRLQEEHWWVDVWRFAHLIESTHSKGNDIDYLTEAVNLYKGNFLEGCYFDWQEPLRRHYLEQYLSASLSLSSALGKHGRYEEALAIVDRGIQFDPLYEELHAEAIALEGKIGRISAAKKRYVRLENILADELREEPHPSTRKLIAAVAESEVRAGSLSG